MRTSTSAFLPYDQHKKKLQEDKTDSSIKQQQSKVKATPSKSPRTKRATSVPPRKKTATTNTTTPKASANQQPVKVWIKPKAKETITNGDSNKETSANKVQRPQQQNNLNKELKQATNGRASPPILKSGPVRTTQIKTPEELSGNSLKNFLKIIIDFI